MSSEAAYFPKALASPTDVSSLAGQSSPASAAGDAGEPKDGIEIADEDLLAQLRDGDQRALVLLFRRYARMVRAVACRILRDEAEAEDLVQEVFLFIFRKAALFDATRGSARSWIVQVTYHRAIDRRRHLASRGFYAATDLDGCLFRLEEPAADTAFYEETIQGSLGSELVRRIEDGLSPDQRQTLQLHFFAGYTFEEIAAHLGQKVGNVRNHYYRALERIRKLIFRPQCGDQ